MNSKDKKIFDYLKPKLKDEPYNLVNLANAKTMVYFVLIAVENNILQFRNPDSEVVNIDVKDLYKINTRDKRVEYINKDLNENFHGHIHMNGKFAVVEFPIDKTQTFNHGVLDSQNRRLIATFATEPEAKKFANHKNTNKKHHNISGFEVVPFDKDAYHEVKMVGSDNLKNYAHQTMENFFNDNLKTL